jgi:predicted DNA-binding transcriptional regulator YafY
MRYEKTKQILELARAMAGSAEGLTLEEMCALSREGRRTVQRMCDVVRDLFPQMEEISDHPTKRFRIPAGLDSFFQDPTAEELSDLSVAISELKAKGATARVESLTTLERKIRAAMRQGRRRATETDVEALQRAELIVVQAGPKATEDPAMMKILRNGLLGMKMLRFIYHGGTKPDISRDVVPYGIIFGRMNYLIGAEAGTAKPKTWRLDKIDQLECLETSAVPPEDFSLAKFAENCFGFFEAEPEDVVLHILPRGMEDFKNYCFHPSQTFEEHPEGGVIVRFRVSGMLELAWHLFTWGNKIVVVEPISLRELLTTELRVALHQHEEPPLYTYNMDIKKVS